MRTAAVLQHDFRRAKLSVLPRINSGSGRHLASGASREQCQRLLSQSFGARIPVSYSRDEHLRPRAIRCQKPATVVDLDTVTTSTVLEMNVVQIEARPFAKSEGIRSQSRLVNVDRRTLRNIV